MVTACDLRNTKVPFICFLTMAIQLSFTISVNTKLYFQLSAILTKYIELWYMNIKWINMTSWYKQSSCNQSIEKYRKEFWIDKSLYCKRCYITNLHLQYDFYIYHHHCSYFNFTIGSPETYSEPYQTSKMKLSTKIFKGFQPLTISAKIFG